MSVFKSYLKQFERNIEPVLLDILTVVVEDVRYKASVNPHELKNYSIGVAIHALNKTNKTNKTNESSSIVSQNKNSFIIKEHTYNISKKIEPQKHVMYEVDKYINDTNLSPPSQSIINKYIDMLPNIFKDKSFPSVSKIKQEFYMQKGIILLDTTARMLQQKLTN